MFTSIALIIKSYYIKYKLHDSNACRFSDREIHFENYDESTCIVNAHTLVYI